VETSKGSRYDWFPADGEPSLAAVGEDAALAAAIPLLPASEYRLLGPGDDAAVIAAPDGRYVVTSDTMIQGPDFRLEWTSPEALGWKLVATNLADVAAMGARPTALTVSLALPGEIRASALPEIATGMRRACEAAGASDSDIEAMFYSNAAKLYKIGG
jgi:thiamine-monophosphate kinase